MGDKTEARRSMIKAGVPVTPGTEGNVTDIAEAAGGRLELINMLPGLAAELHLPRHPD